MEGIRRRLALFLVLTVALTTAAGCVGGAEEAVRDSSDQPRVAPTTEGGPTTESPYVLGTDAADTYREKLSASGTIVADLSEAATLLGFAPRGLESIEGEIDTIVVDDKLTAPDGSAIGDKPTDQRVLVVFLADGTIVQQALGIGYAGPDEMIESQFRETGAQGYKHRISLATVEAVAWDGGTHAIQLEDGSAMELEVPSALIMWYAEGLVTSVASEHEMSYKKLLPVASEISQHVR